MNDDINPTPGDCIFCGHKSADLDLHYTYNCPMTKQCPHCVLVVEIQHYDQHLVSECDQRDEWFLCPTCNYAVRKRHAESHVSQKNACRPTVKGVRRCPMCALSVADNDESWRSHLITACAQNPKRRKSQKRHPEPNVEGLQTPTSFCLDHQT